MAPGFARSSGRTTGVETHTSVTLLGRLRQFPTDQKAWLLFTERYGRKILVWCRQWNLQEADSEDVTQTVLLKLAEKMKTFDYDATKSFRAWLKTVTRHVLGDYCDSRKAVAVGGDQTIELLGNLKAREDLVQRLDEEFDRELFEEAASRVKSRVTPKTWEAFERTAIQGQSGSEVGAELGMKVATVFVARSKVQKMLQEEVQKLEGIGESITTRRRSKRTTTKNTDAEMVVELGLSARSGFPGECRASPPEGPSAVRPRVSGRLQPTGF
jgi:RNA polymerase sigma factor (sigma-70 family)